MATIQEIESGIEAAKKIIDNPNSSDAVKKVAQKQLAKFVKEREALGNAAQTNETTQEVVQAGGDVVSAILATLKSYMESNAGGGLDSESVRAMIKAF